MLNPYSNHCFQGDLTQKKDVEQVFINHQFDTVFHCASYGMSGREQVCDLVGLHPVYKTGQVQN